MRKASNRDDVYYILSETDLERYGRVLDSLVLSENNGDTVNDLVVLEKFATAPTVSA